MIHPPYSITFNLIRLIVISSRIEGQIEKGETEWLYQRVFWKLQTSGSAVWWCRCVTIWKPSHVCVGGDILPTKLIKPGLIIKPPKYVRWLCFVHSAVSSLTLPTLSLKNQLRCVQNIDLCRFQLLTNKQHHPTAALGAFEYLMNYWLSSSNSFYTRMNHWLFFSKLCLSSMVSFL